MTLKWDGKTVSPPDPAGVVVRTEDGGTLPCLDVRTHEILRFLPTPGQVAARFRIGPDHAEKILDWACEFAAETFWADARAPALQHLGPGAVVGQVGRAGGRLVVRGLPPVAEWGEDLRGAWASFSDSIDELMRRGAAPQNLYRIIDKNQWFKCRARRHNFYGETFGKQTCLADVRCDVATYIERQWNIPADVILGGDEE